MSFREISHKKVDMTDDEYNEYIRICRSYDRAYFKGEELFKDLFETNEEGKIIYIKGLGNKQFTFEVMFFVMNLMQNQWLRVSVSGVNKYISEATNKIDEKMKQLDERMALLDEKLKKLDVKP